MMKFTEEESVYAGQLVDIRRKIAILQVEEDTQTDRLLSILRGHRATVAYTHDNKILITRFVAESKEGVLVEETHQ